MTPLTDLIARVEAADRNDDNALDVLVEIALFKPNEIYSSIRANNAGSKVIVTDHVGRDITFRAWDWTMAENRASTIASLKAMEARQ